MSVSRKTDPVGYVCVCARTHVYTHLSLSLAQLYLTLCDSMDSHSGPLSMEFSRQAHWNGLPFSSLGDLPDPGIEPRSPTLKADWLPCGPPGKPVYTHTYVYIFTHIIHACIHLYMHIHHTHIYL